MGKRKRGALVALCVWVCACGGGGGSSPDESSEQADTGFSLVSVGFGRPILDHDGELVDVVHPASLHETDPLTGVVVPGFPKPLFPGESLTDLAEITLAQIVDPITPQVPVVPRNAALVLELSGDVDGGSLPLGHDGTITAATPVKLVRKDGALVPTRVWVRGNRLVLVGITAETVGWEASPLVFGPTGDVVADAAGHLTLVLGALPGLRAVDGTPYSHRADRLASPSRPLPINPGNAALDAIVLQTDGGVVTFNGFLPDVSPPRLLRPVRLAGTVGTVDSVSVAGATAFRIHDPLLDPVPSEVANGGLGEWARSLMEIHSVGGVTNRYVVDANGVEAGATVFRLAPGQSLHPSVQPGDGYTLVRTELFEPLPPPLPVDPIERARVTVDPESHPRDPHDPQDLLNSDLRYFVRVFDERGVERTDVWDPSRAHFAAVPPKSTLRLWFSEPMDVDSLRPYESFYITDAGREPDDPAFDAMRPGVVAASPDRREIEFRPELVDQEDPQASRFVGFGGSSGAVRLVLRTLPDPAVVAALEETASPHVRDRLVDLAVTGIAGCTDLGGRGLGLPAALLDQGDREHFLLSDGSPVRGPFPPAVDFAVEIETQLSDDPEYGVVVHRFLGQPQSANVSYPPGPQYDSVEAGIEYHDHAPLDEDGDGVLDRRFLYGPTTYDLGLHAPGHLTGRPAVAIEHVLDDFNAPKPSSFASPNGEDFLVNTGFGASVPLASPFGARFQQIFRAGDASPAHRDFEGVVLDLVGLAWSPDEDTINDQDIDGMQMLVGVSGINSGFGPSTSQNAGITHSPQSGLRAQFDCNLLEWRRNCSQPDPDPELRDYEDDQPPRTTVVNKGTRYELRSSKLFRPQSGSAIPGQFNMYMPYPKFDAGLDPYFGRDDVFAFPYDSRFPMVVELRIQPNAPDNVPTTPRNFYRFSSATLIGDLPRFRAWSVGQHPLAHCIPNWTIGTGTGGGYFRGGEGGPLLEPGCTTKTVRPPELNNGMPDIEPSAYILPPRKVAGVGGQPAPDFEHGVLDGSGCIETLPTCNSDPDMNFYFANGMLAYPLPETGDDGQPLTAPGPGGTTWYGYGVPVFGMGPPPCAIQPTGELVVNEPAYDVPPTRYGDGSRYFTLFQYRKRVSIIESPTLRADNPNGRVRYLRPIVEPPLAELDPAAGMILEFRAGTSVGLLEGGPNSDYVPVQAVDFSDALTGDGADRPWVKFRATFGVANGETLPPALDTVVIPYEKLPN